MFVFSVLTLNLDRIVNGTRLSSRMCTQIPTHMHMHMYMYKLTKQEKSSAFPEAQSSGMGTLDLVIISRAVSFDLLLMSVLGSSHL